MFENSLGFNLNYYLNEIVSNNLDKKFNNSCIWRNFLNCWKFFKIKLKNNGIYKEDINNKNDNLNFIIKKKIKNDLILQKIRNISENYWQLNYYHLLSFFLLFLTKIFQFYNFLINFNLIINNINFQLNFNKIWIIN